jgi:glycogen debranching enzyme
VFKRKEKMEGKKIGHMFLAGTVESALIGGTQEHKNTPWPVERKRRERANEKKKNCPLTAPESRDKTHRRREWSKNAETNHQQKNTTNKISGWGRLTVRFFASEVLLWLEKSISPVRVAPKL